MSTRSIMLPKMLYKRRENILRGKLKRLASMQMRGKITENDANEQGVVVIEEEFNRITAELTRVFSRIHLPKPSMFQDKEIQDAKNEAINSWKTVTSLVSRL